MQQPSSTLFSLSNKKSLILLSVGAFVVLASVIGGIAFAVSTGSKQVEPEGLDPSSHLHDEAGTQAFLTQGFNSDHQPAVDPLSPSAPPLESSSSSPSTTNLKVKPEPVPAKQPAKVHKKKKPLKVVKPPSDGETTVNDQVKINQPRSKKRTIIIASVLAVLLLASLIIGATLFYLFRFHWASDPITDPEPVKVETADSQPEEAKEEQPQEQRELSYAMQWVVYFVTKIISFPLSAVIVISLVVLASSKIGGRPLFEDFEKIRFPMLVLFFVIQSLLCYPVRGFLTRLILDYCF